MRSRKSIWFLTGIVLTISGMFCFVSSETQAAPQGTLKMAIHWSLSADSLDPSLTSVSTLIYLPLQLFHDALLKPMAEGFYTPCLAESYSVTPDYKVYEFRLRRGVKFHNGDPMTAEDVVFSFWRYKGAQAQYVHSNTEKVEVVNPHQVRFHFKKPMPDYMDLFLPGVSGIGWVVPKKYVEKVGDAGFKRHPIGAGPYKFVEYVPGVRIVAEAFEDYWRKVPNIKRIEFHYIPEPATRLAMVRRGEADIGTLLTDIFYQDAKKDTALRLLEPQSPNRWLAYMTAQWDTKSPWSDVRVRQAASLAIDRKTLADIHMPGCKPIGSIALEEDPFGVQFPADPYDPERAKRLLAEAGYPKGFHGGKFYPQSTYPGYGEQIATYWKAVGITVDYLMLERAAWFAARDSGKMKGDLFLDASNSPSIGGRVAYLFGPNSYGNYPDIKALWEQFQQEVSPKVRKDLIARIQRLVYERMMWIPLTSTNSPAAIGPRVKGNPYRVQPLLWITAPFEDIELGK
jgi:peptide/nickel transport system substrate-binding protein